MSRRLKTKIGVVTCVLVAHAAAACASDEAATKSERPPAAARLEHAPLATTRVEGAVLDPLTLTSAFRESLARASGVDVVDQIQAEAALMACAEPPCPNATSDAYAHAPIVFSASIAESEPGRFLGMGRALEGARVIKRVTAGDDDAVGLVEQLGTELGAAVHDELVARGGAPAPAAEGQP